MRVPVRSVTAALFLFGLEALALGQTRSTCGPAVASCGPAIVGTGDTAPTPAPSWVSSMLAAWMLDEASGTRVNAQGTTARDLSNTDNLDPIGNTHRMEGAMSAAVTASSAKHTNDTFPSLVAPLTVGCWVDSSPIACAFVMHDYNTTAGTFQLLRTVTGGFAFSAYDSGGTIHTATTANSWNAAGFHHVAGTLVSGGSLIVYVDGAQQATAAMGTAAAHSGAFYLSDNYCFGGYLDECFLAPLAISAASICRVCSCGIRGEQCMCSGSTYTTTGRNATACGSCTLPASCSAPPS